MNPWKNTHFFLPLTSFCTQLQRKACRKWLPTKSCPALCDFIAMQRGTGRQVRPAWQRDTWNRGPAARFESTPSRKWSSISDLSWWQLVLRAWSRVTGECLWPSWAVTAQISRSCQSSFHSRAYVKMRPVSLGWYRRLSLPLAWPACLFVTSSTLTHSPSVCSSVCVSSSINLLSLGFTKTPFQLSDI